MTLSLPTDERRHYERSKQLVAWLSQGMLISDFNKIKKTDCYFNLGSKSTHYINLTK